jgi:hypothetical protein
MSAEATSDRRMYVRLPARIPLEWTELEPTASHPSTHRTETRDIGANGLAFTHSAALAVGTYLRLLLEPSQADANPVIEAIVTTSHATESGEGAHYTIGVRYSDASEHALHGLLLQAYEEIGDFTCLCLSIRHCGEVRERCVAAQTSRNCWQVDEPPCCHWIADRDCKSCPVSLLAFLH